MATIRIDDTIRATKSHSDLPEIGGVFSIRAISTDHRSRKTSYLEKPSAEDEDSGLRRAGDFKQKQVFTALELLFIDSLID
jgi:KUP system potassium uptake protein